MKKNEHPFAEYIRILGKGKRGSRHLTQQEAFAAMKMILADEVEPEQLGAFLMLMRVKEETAEELAGFVLAARESIVLPQPSLSVDLDWSSYAGKRRHLPWFILSALLLAENGISIFMHGSGGHTKNRIYTGDILQYLGIPTATTLQQATQQIRENRFSYLALEHFSPKLGYIIRLRSLLGLRSPIHTLTRMLNPMKSAYSIQGIFHPAYRPLHQETALLLKQPYMAVLKGEGGEIERNPDMPCQIQSVAAGKLIDEQWPALFNKRHLKPKVLNPSELTALWRGELTNEYAEATVIGTAAIALKLLGKAETQQGAEKLANDYWSRRSKQRIKAVISNT